MLTALLVLVLTACGAGTSAPPPTTKDSAATTTTTTFLPGTGRPPVNLGDKNFTEQFILGELYSQALTAQGFTVTLNKNIGSTQVTTQALEAGQLDMYPEYVGTFDSAVANDTEIFRSEHDAVTAAQRYAIAHGLRLLTATPFSDTDAIAVLSTYGAEHHLRLIADLGRLESALTLGAPPQFASSQSGLLGIQGVYGVTPAHFQPLAIGLQYQALQAGSVQAADVFTTDGQLASGQYQLLSDPDRLFGFGNVVPVVTQSALLVEGPAFAQTIDSVSAQLTTPAMRMLNADVSIYNMSPATAARQFLIAHGLITG
ncbi:MAG TPA: glycine betaine ABC transporter substrate-binding protein [Solirubrobacteraceae bacterium]|jgi:osmoprotectant transport system substrate-binding protein|nr:glycine betaine ABC transporter substrate-binding protein [Solirubrobacteraceae bacterium]